MSHSPSKGIRPDKTRKKSHTNECEPCLCRQFRKLEVLHPDNSEDYKTDRMFDSDDR